MSETREPRRGMSLIEVVVSSMILGVISIAYAGLSKVQVGQKEGYEELGTAMEIVSRQLEYLRQLDLTLASNGPPAPTGGDRRQHVPPFSSFFNNGGTGGNAPCPDGNNMAYVTGFMLESGFVAASTTRPMSTFLTGSVLRIAPPNMLNAVADTNCCVLPGRSTVGPADTNRPLELTLPPRLVTTPGSIGKDYTVVVRATRVRATTTLPVQNDQFLVHYQVNVFKGGRPVLVVPYLRGAEL